MMGKMMGRPHKTARALRRAAITAALDEAGALRQPSALPQGLSWHILMVQPGREERLAGELAREPEKRLGHVRGVLGALPLAVYRPMERVLAAAGKRGAASPGPRKVCVVERPLFAGYVFVARKAGADGARAPMDFAAVESLTGARGWLRVDSRPVTLSPDLVHALWRDEAAGRFDRVSALRRGGCRDRFKPGQEVEIIDGPFAPGRAVVAVHGARGTVRIIHRMFGAERLIDVPLDDIRAA